MLIPDQFLPKQARVMDDAEHDVQAYTSFPASIASGCTRPIPLSSSTKCVLRLLQSLIRNREFDQYELNRSHRGEATTPVSLPFTEELRQVAAAQLGWWYSSSSPLTPPLLLGTYWTIKHSARPPHDNRRERRQTG